MLARFDRRLMTQALTNVVKNATEAIEAVPPDAARAGPHHRVASREGGDDRHRRRRQRHRPADGGPRAAARALRDDAREGHRPRPRDRRARSWRSTAARSSCSTRRAVAGGGRGALDAAAFPRRGAAAEDRAVASGSLQATSGDVSMAADILIVDDEADIREIWSPASSRTRATRRARRATATARSRRSRARRPSLVFLDIWLQGSRLDGLALLDDDQAAASRPAGGDDLRPRQHRDRGLRDQARRLRLHREAVQGRPAGAGRRARARSLAAQARGQGARSSSRRCRRR